jgi:galacturan 1,4-alpha-galacturonidase
MNLICYSFILQSLSFNLMTNSIVRDITSKDSKFFHINIIGSRNFTFQRVTISAPQESINTDGIHIGRSKDIKVLDSTINTGDDCVSLGDGSKQVSVTKVTCGSGHGISIGSLGKYPNEEPVEGVHVKNCTLINTTNGVRVKTWPGSRPGVATDMHFEDIIVRNVTNPILIDQEYCPWYNCKQGVSKKDEHAYPLASISLSFQNKNFLFEFPFVK